MANFYNLIMAVFTITSALSSDDIYTPDEICAPNPYRADPVGASVPGSKESCRDSVLKHILKGHPDKLKTTPELLDTYGYPFETYEATTTDGYVLTTYRIPGTVENSGNQTKPAVLLLHGMSLASDGWFFQPGTRNLPFKLIDAGFEVWLGNARGTTYSLDHRKLDSQTDLKYWDFDWHEMGVYDLPPVVDQILQVSQNDKIYVIGYSMGTTQYFVALSENTDLNEKIHAGFMMAPAGHNGHMSHGIRPFSHFLATHARYRYVVLQLHGVIQHEKQMRKYFGLTQRDLCDGTAVKCGLCDSLIYAMYGYNEMKTNQSEIPRILSKFSNTVSVKTYAHYAQSVETCKFRKYDYGDLENIPIYGSSSPPDYRLDRITVPTFFYYGAMDKLAPPNDVFITARKFRPGMVTLYRVADETFNHVDFMTAKDADFLVYNRVLADMQKLEVEKATKEK